ncbi:hypothetical protein FA13DRAFT_1907336 [Coprinellus micaceus]|uniref:Uncharacterized protein n=1 Tax=Coprinellus micaceus TaxID=71717 RepID=A0A4Y7STP4_COPMI|nr:hypothetical protein FA13DRAFT_1907336 [Coprinellus micaceus]
MPHQFTLNAGVVHGRQNARGGAVNEGSVNGDVYNGAVSNQCYDNRRNTYTTNGGGYSAVNGDLYGTQYNARPAPFYPQGNSDYYGWPGYAPHFQGPRSRDPPECCDTYYTGHPHFHPAHSNLAVTNGYGTFKQPGPKSNSIGRHHSVRGKAGGVA